MIRYDQQVFVRKDKNCEAGTSFSKKKVVVSDHDFFLSLKLKTYDQ